MDAKQVIPGLRQVSLGFVNVFLIDTSDGLALIDTGVAGSAPKILNAVRALGKQPSDVRLILVTHCHTDHAGSLAELKRLTGAPAAMHPIDAAMTREGKGLRPLSPAPGFFNAIVSRFMIAGAPSTVEPAEIEQEIHDGETVIGALQAIHVPGHCEGQLAFLCPEQNALIAADAAANAFGLALSPMYEDLNEGRRSLEKLGSLDFEVACFGHGRAIPKQASQRFRQKWPAPSPSRKTV